jgi:N-methylhydantoinase A
VSGGLRVAVDIGGTFTDLIAIDDRTGEVIEAKSSTTPGDFSTGVLNAIDAGEINPVDIASLTHGTTVVINAITQRSGVKTALITTAGFRDALAIGRGNRPDMYNLRFHKPEPFVPRSLRFEVHERVTAAGDILTPLDLAELEPIADAIEQAGVEAIAICFLHGYAHPEHESLVAEFLRGRLTGIAISASHEITREWREFERTSTVVLNAYVQPILDRYLGNLESKLREREVDARLFAMLSNGGSATFDSARKQPVQLVESGPAGGIIGAAIIGRQLGEANVISLDIGGTTAKCSLIENGEIKISGDYRLEWTPLSPGYPVRVPVVDIVEIGAGGGSIAWFDDGGALRVGPKSAGAVPGPACYGRGGIEPTVTDAMLITGVIDPTHFLGGRLTIHPELARQAYAPIAERLGISIDAAAAGVIHLVNEATIDALKLISIRRGHDPRDFTLVAFGGGGPMHAAALASELQVKQVVIPPRSGTFSAWGMLMAQPRIDLTRTRVTRVAPGIEVFLNEGFADIEAEATARFADQGYGDAAVIEHRRALDLRYHGQEHTVRLPIEIGASQTDIESAFHQLHRQTYTFALEDTAIEIVNLRTISTIATATALVRKSASAGHATETPEFATRLVDFGDGERRQTAVFARTEMPTGCCIFGPAIIEELSATTVVMPNQMVSVDEFNNLIIRNAAHAERSEELVI